MAQMRAANASLKAVEDGIQLHATNRDYGKLKETAEASGLAAKVRASNFCISSVNDASPCMQQYKPISGMQQRVQAKRFMRGLAWSCVFQIFV